MMMTKMTTVKMMLTLMMILLNTMWAEGKLYKKCYAEGHCFYTSGQQMIQQPGQKLDTLCNEMDSQSGVLELHDRLIKKNVADFLKTNDLKLEKVPINLMRVDQPWTWLDGEVYKAEKGMVKTKEYFVDVKSEPFAFVNRMSLNILPNPGPVTKSHLSELDKFLCSFKGSCEQSKLTNKFQVEDMCYTYHDKKGVNWMEAYNECSLNNSALAIIPPELLGKFKINAKKVLLANNPYWIGLSRVQWVWSSRPGQKIDFYDWYSGYPHPKLISMDPSLVFACVEPNNGYIWKDYAIVENVTLVCMTKSSDENWDRTRKEVITKKEELIKKCSIDCGSVLCSQMKGIVPENKALKSTSKTDVIAVSVVLGVLLVTSLVANIILAVLLSRKKKAVPCEDQKKVVDEYFNYE